MLENVSSKGHVRVNGKTLDKDSDIVLTGGDEVVFSSTGRHAYVSFLLSLQEVNWLYYCLSSHIISSLFGSFGFRDVQSRQRFAPLRLTLVILLLNSHTMIIKFNL